MTKVRDFLGPYRLTRLIRMGNSSHVWEAVESATGKRFALKVLRDEHRANKEEIAFLKNEFEVAQALNHPYIIKVIDLVLDKSLPPFLVLELFSELNIKQALRRGPTWHVLADTQRESLEMIANKLARICYATLRDKEPFAERMERFD